MWFPLAGREMLCSNSAFSGRVFLTQRRKALPCLRLFFASLRLCVRDTLPTDVRRGHVKPYGTSTNDASCLTSFFVTMSFDSIVTV